MRFGADYDLLLKAQKRLCEQLDRPMKPVEYAKLSQALVMVVSYKRELRGLPRLRSCDMIAGLKRLPANAQRTTDAAPIELAPEPLPSKESLKHSPNETVTAPPTGTPPSREE